MITLVIIIGLFILIVCGGGILIYYVAMLAIQAVIWTLTMVFSFLALIYCAITDPKGTAARWKATKVKK